jgi:hypothetical protein
METEGAFQWRRTKGYGAMVKWKAQPAVFLISFLSLLVTGSVRPAQASDSPIRLEQAQLVAQGVQEIVPLSMRMVDSAIGLLSAGGQPMPAAEQAIFELIFDPASSGGIDDDYLADVLANLRQIRLALGKPFRVRLAPENGPCAGERLYYTDLVSVVVCPYFLVEGSEIRKARGLVHEIAHMTLLVADRPYFVPGSEEYACLAPRGEWPVELPLIGPILREVLRGDTLYHPDAYAHLVSALSGIPGQLELYQRFLPAPDAGHDATAGYFVRYH